MVTVSREAEGKHPEVRRAENLLEGSQGLAWNVRSPQKGWQEGEQIQKG